MLKELISLFEQHTQETLLRSEELTQAGSGRRYYRLRSASHSLIGCFAGNIDENRCFFYLSTHFRSKGLPFPKVLCVAPDKLHYLQEDLGDTSLFQKIASGSHSGHFTREQKDALHQTIALLPHIQYTGAQGLDFSRCYPQPIFNLQAIQLDLYYFKYYFLKPNLLDFDEVALEKDFKTLAQLIDSTPKDCFMYRDFQSRNVMWHKGSPHFIDFQGGRQGMPHYDVASFLYQAKASYPAPLREELLNTYLSEAKTLSTIDEASFRSQLPLFALFRTMQVLGAYGFRGYFERKAHFLQSVPYATANLHDLLHSQALSNIETPYLNQLLEQLVAAAPPKPTANPLSRLQVRVLSFSYLKGIPADPSGHGGGFLFDCRSIINPGRTEEYKTMTGLDRPVIEFIESNDQMKTFLGHALGLVKPAVERYAERGFRNLMVGFGCTGGQHRSVYAAQRMAEHLAQYYPSVDVLLEHREQGIHKEWIRV